MSEKLFHNIVFFLLGVFLCFFIMRWVNKDDVSPSALRDSVAVHIERANRLQADAKQSADNSDYWKAIAVKSKAKTDSIGKKLEQRSVEYTRLRRHAQELAAALPHHIGDTAAFDTITDDCETEKHRLQMVVYAQDEALQACDTMQADYMAHKESCDSTTQAFEKSLEGMTQAYLKEHKANAEKDTALVRQKELTAKEHRKSKFSNILNYVFAGAIIYLTAQSHIAK